jgi:hypothetical protein
VSELSEAEREALAAWWASEWPRDERDVLDTLAAIVEQVVAAHTAALAAKVAAVEALADRWADDLTRPRSMHRFAAADHLRRALAAVPDTAADVGGDAGVGL